MIAPWVFAAPAVAFAFLPAAVGADRLTGGVAVTGAVTALTALAGVLIQPAARALDALRWRWPVGMVGLLVCAAGLVLSAYAVQAGSLWLLAPCAAVLGCAYGLCLVSGLIEVGRLAPPEAVGSLTSVYYALAYLGLTTPYLLTLASPLAGDRTLLLIAAAALTSAAVVASAGRPAANAAVDDRDRDRASRHDRVVLERCGLRSLSQIHARRRANLRLKGRHMISPELHIALARAKADDLRRAADAHRLTHRRAQPGRPVATERSVTLRFASPADQRPLARLAELDSSTPPTQPVLLAEVDGQLRAALALTDGTLVADPFHPTADLIDLLRARARQLDATPSIKRSRRLRSWFGLRGLAWS